MRNGLEQQDLRNCVKLRGWTCDVLSLFPHVISIYIFVLLLLTTPTVRSSSMRTRGPGSPCPLSPDSFWQYITMSGSTLLASHPAWRTAHAQIPRQSCPNKPRTHSTQSSNSGSGNNSNKNNNDRQQHTKINKIVSIQNGFHITT